MRASLVPGALLAAVLCTGGCTTPATSLRRPHAVAEKKDAADKEKTTEPAQTEVAKADSAKSDSPFQSSREKNGKPADKTESVAKTTADIAPADKPTDAASTKSADAATAAKPPHFTRETLQLIDSELRDATPDERALWYEQLKLVDASLIPEILRARRLSLQLAETTTPPVASRADRETATSPRAASPVVDIRPGLAATPPSAAPLTSAPPFGDRTGIQQTAYAADQNRGAMQSAVYQTPAGTPQPVEQAVYKFDPQRPQQTIVLQNMEYQPPPTTTINGSPYPTAPTTNASSPPVTLDPRLLPQTSAVTPAPVPWPPAKPTPPAAPSTPFGSGFVQNVVGLMPNRGAAANAPATTAAAPATPISFTSTAEWKQELDRTTAFLEQEVAALKPGTTPDAQAAYVRKHVALRMLYLMGEHQERALTAIPGLPPAEQEFWQQLCWGLSNALDSDHIPNAKDRATQTITQLNSAVRRLQEQADLQIRNVTFCRQIQYFGNYERFPRDEFRPGQEVLLYAEIDNFKSEPTADGQYRTLLRSTLELLSPSGELRKVIDFPATEDLCRNYRRDYFHNYQFVIPERLPLGPHTLKLTVFDELSGKMSSYSVNFVVK